MANIREIENKDEQYRRYIKDHKCDVSDFIF